MPEDPAMEGVPTGVWYEQDWEKFEEKYGPIDEVDWSTFNMKEWMEDQHDDREGDDHHDWEHHDDDNMDWEAEWGSNPSEGDMEFEGDWFGDLVNNPCAEECEVTDCEYGEICLETWCTDPCTGDRWCTQDLTFNYDEWEQYDCTEGLVAADQECEEVCEYLECDESHQ
jgi:hypothetical protein